MNIVYILSDVFNYCKLICDDAGPGYAESMNWKFVKLSKLSSTKADEVFVIDNRIEQDELMLLEETIKRHSKQLFFFKIVDPYLENKSHYYYQFVSKLSTLNNAYLLSVYQAAEITLELKKQFNNKFIHLPYPYLQKKEREDYATRKNRIIISGSINNIIYPYMYNIWKKVTRSFTRFIFFSILKHPGYIDLSNKNHLHNFIHEDFINYLSSYRYMLMCPTHLRLELLKYNECAYAACIPVGIPPDCYPENIKQMFLNLRSTHFINDLLGVFFKKHSPQIVPAIRDFLRKSRNPDTLNQNFKKFIFENPLYTP